MKRTLIIVALLLASRFGASSQNVTAYKYSLVDDYLMNPAYGGTQDYYSATFGVEQRFMGIDVSPKTAYISLHSKVGKGYLFDKDGTINKFFSKFGNSSFGFQFFQYSFFPQYETNIGITYGHHVKLKPDFMTKNPRLLVLAMTPRYQLMGFNRGALTTASSGGDGVTPIYPDPLIPLDLNSNPKAHILNLDVAALYQTVHVDVGLSALNILGTKNSFELINDNFVIPDESFDIFDSIYSPLLALNTKLKFLNIIQEDKLNIQFIPKFTALYAYQRGTYELFVDLALENTFFKILAGSRRNAYMVGTVGLSINHLRNYSPVTFMRPYLSIDYNNYVITYSYAYTLHSDIMNLILGGNQITFGLKISNDREVKGKVKPGKWYK
jgi:hypothetical protein